MHGQHGDLGHHVLETTVGLEPAGTLAEGAGDGRTGRLSGDQGAYQRHLVGGEVAPVIAAGDGHPGSMRSRRRSGLIDHGSHGSRSSGALLPFLAQASSHS